MNQLSIQRNPETKFLEVCMAFNDNLTVSFEIQDLKNTELLIKSTCEAANPVLDDDFFISKFREQYGELKIYSRYRAKIMLNLDVDINSNFIFYKLVCCGILTMNEIYWFDWYVKKHKLIKSNND